MLMRGLMLVLMLAMPWAARAADAPAVVTILEGDALIYRGLGRVRVVEGLRLTLGDIVETGAKTFMQLELPDRTTVQFGPATRAMLNGGTSRQKTDRWLYVMDGWCKVSAPKTPTENMMPLDVRTRQFDITPVTGVVLFQLAPGETTVFDERGDIRVLERQASGAPIAVALRGDDYYKRKAGERGVVNPGGNAAFLSAMPQPFRDSLPARIERYRDSEIRPGEASDFAYGDVESWLKAEPPLRKPLMQRWRAKARDPAFRAALIANLPAHPEWDPILFPEKYIKKDLARRAVRSPTAAASVPSNR